MMKTLKKVGIEWNFLNMIKDTMKNPQLMLYSMVIAVVRDSGFSSKLMWLFKEFIFFCSCSTHGGLLLKGQQKKRSLTFSMSDPWTLFQRAHLIIQDNLPFD